MAEAVLAPETEVTPPEDVANPTPEVTTEGAPEGVNQEEESSIIDDILAGIDSESTSTANDGKGVTTDGTAPSAQTLTPEEAKEQGRREKEQEIASERTSLERQNYINGLNYVVKDVPEKVKQIAKEYGLDFDATDRLTSEFNRLYGALKPLYDHAVEQQRPQIEQQADQRTQATVAQLIYDKVKEDLGDSAVKALQDAGAKTWGDFVDAVGKGYRKGYVPAADYTSKKAVKELLGKYDAALKERGLSLADITGNGGQDLPRAQGGTGTRYATTSENDKAFNEGRQTREQWKANDDRLTGKGTK